MAWLQVLICRLTSDAFIVSACCTKGVCLPFLFLGFLLGELMMPRCSGQASAAKVCVLWSATQYPGDLYTQLIRDAC